MAAVASSLARRAVSWRQSLLSRAFAAAAAGGTEPAKRVLVPVAAGTEPVEAAASATADVLNRAGTRVTVATAAPAGDDGLVMEAAYGVKLVADGRVADLEGEAFDLIALPGGMPGSVNLRDCKVLEKMVKKQAEKGGLYGAICAARAVTLAHWGMLKGLKATCYPSFMEKFTAEVIPVNSRLVVDRNAVTSQGPGTAIEFALALVERLYGKEKMEEVAGPLHVRPQHGAEYTIEELNSVEWKCSGTPQVPIILLITRVSLCSKLSINKVPIILLITRVSLCSKLSINKRKKVSPKGFTFVRCASVTTTSLAARSVAMWVNWHADWLMLEPS